MDYRNFSSALSVAPKKFKNSYAYIIPGAMRINGDGVSIIVRDDTIVSTIGECKVEAATLKKLITAKKAFALPSSAECEKGAFCDMTATDSVNAITFPVTDRLAYVLRAFAADNSKYAIAGALFSPDGVIVSTDGSRLHSAKIPTLSQLKSNLVLNGKGLELVSKLFKKKGFCRMYQLSDGALFCGDGIVIKVDAINMSFPPYNDVIPKNNIHKIKVEGALFMDEIKKADVYTNKQSKGICLLIDGDNCRLYASSTSMGEYLSPMFNIGGCGQKITWGFSPCYMLEGLSEGENVIYFDVRANKPCLITADNTLAVIMPVNLSDTIVEIEEKAWGAFAIVDHAANAKKDDDDAKKVAACAATSTVSCVMPPKRCEACGNDCEKPPHKATVALADGVEREHTVCAACYRGIKEVEDDAMCAMPVTPAMDKFLSELTDEDKAILDGRVCFDRPVEAFNNPTVIPGATAAYSPDDNKIRMTFPARLDVETYAMVIEAGYKWAPKQECFYAPMWTPGREDIALELCGSIGDDDSSLMERAEERADRFTDYKEARVEDAVSARDGVQKLAGGIPLGQPILIGHHSEKRARKDAEKIQNGMDKACKAWETAAYWEQRARAAVAHAKYKELPAVRARRIKTLEADMRKMEREKAQSEGMRRAWEQAANHPTASEEMLKRMVGTLYGKVTVNGVTDYPSQFSPREVFNNMHFSTVRESRWIAHYQNRIAYERAMLGELPSDQVKPEIGGAVNFAGMMRYILKVNKTGVTVNRTESQYTKESGYRQQAQVVVKKLPKFEDLSGIMSKAQVDEARNAGRIVEDEFKTGFTLSDAPAPAPRKVYEPSDIQKQADEAKETAAVGVQIVQAHDLFPTPAAIVERMIEVAGIEPGMDVLEPSAGTGAIVRAIPCIRPKGSVTACEINSKLAYAPAIVEYVDVVENCDFLTLDPIVKYDRVVMNPPFSGGADIAHIRHAMLFLRPGGRLVALCAGGPRQEAQLRPMAATWESLPAGSFKDSGTNVNVVLLSIEAK